MRRVKDPKESRGKELGKAATTTRNIPLVGNRWGRLQGSTHLDRGKERTWWRRWGTEPPWSWQRSRGKPSRRGGSNSLASPYMIDLHRRIYDCTYVYSKRKAPSFEKWIYIYIYTRLLLAFAFSLEWVCRVRACERQTARGRGKKKTLGDFHVVFWVRVASKDK